ncbi:MAG: hypothetical protein FWG87_14935 [Defluviitaleaceae bacterium]|nr:hypothetical protein [Defluviitaleaceae bacterium]
MADSKGMERGFSRISRIFADFFFVNPLIRVFLLCLAPSVPLCLCVKIFLTNNECRQSV